MRQLELREVSALVDFYSGPGYVLDFSNRDFSRFFATEVGVNIDDPVFADTGGSKGKRLCRFLELTDDRTALRAMTCLWEHRLSMLAGTRDPLADADKRYEKVIARLGSTAAPKPKPVEPQRSVNFTKLRSDFFELARLDPQPRGYAFEQFLASVFEASGLLPKERFRNRGEEIDGSFICVGHTYLLEAKWQSSKIGAASLHSFEGKLRDKASWARGLFVSYSGFTDEGLSAFGRSKQTLCMDGLDLFELLERELTIEAVIEAKARRAVETGWPFVRVRNAI